MLLRDVLENEYGPLRSLKPQARRQYQLTLTRWSETLGREPTMDDLQPLVVQAFLSARRTKVSAASVRKDRTHVCCLWSYCAKVRRTRSDGQLLEFPTVAPVRAPTRLPRAYRVADVSALVRTALGYPSPVCGLPGGLYYASMIRMCWETASRIGAVRQLRWGEVDLEGRAVIFLAETTKTGDRDLRRAISPGLAGWLKQIERKPNDLVFPWDRDPTSLWYEFKKICRVAGVQPRGFHALRKSNASYVTAAAGVVEAASVCGHKDSKVTIDHYIDETIAKPKHTALDFLPPLDLSE
jgi:integrase